MCWRAGSVAAHHVQHPSEAPLALARATRRRSWAGGTGTLPGSLITGATSWCWGRPRLLALTLAAWPARPLRTLHTLIPYLCIFFFYLQPSFLPLHEPLQRPHQWPSRCVSFKPSTSNFISCLNEDKYIYHKHLDNANL